MAGVTFVIMVGDAVISARAVALLSETSIAVHGFPFVHGAVVGCAVMGALIISRYDRHPIGWLLSIIGIFSAVSLCAEAYAYWVQEADGPGSDSMGGVAAWISALFGGQLAIAALTLMFLLAPDGHLVSRRWRYAAWVTGAGAAVVLARRPQPVADLVPALRRGRRHRPGPAADAVGRLHRDQRRADRLGRLAGAADATQHCGAAATAGADRPVGAPDRGRHPLPVRLRAGRRRRAHVAGRDTPLRRLLHGADPVRHLGPPLPPLRHRRDHQPDGRCWWPARPSRPSATPPSW